MSGLGQKSLLRIRQSLRIEKEAGLNSCTRKRKRIIIYTHFFSIFLCSSLDSCNLSRLLVSESICDVLTDVFFLSIQNTPPWRGVSESQFVNAFQILLNPTVLEFFPGPSGGLPTSTCLRGYGLLLHPGAKGSPCSPLLSKYGTPPYPPFTIIRDFSVPPFEGGRDSPIHPF